MNFPDNLKYARSHEWVRIEGTTGYIGITEFAQSELGDIVFIDITVSSGDSVEGGEVFGSIEAVKTVSDVYLPLAGTILEINQKIIDTPETMNSDPYGDGWMVKVELSSPVDTSALLDASAYAEMVGKAH